MISLAREIKQTRGRLIVFAVQANLLFASAVEAIDWLVLSPKEAILKLVMLYGLLLSFGSRVQNPMKDVGRDPSSCSIVVVQIIKARFRAPDLPFSKRLCFPTAVNQNFYR